MSLALLLAIQVAVSAAPGPLEVWQVSSDIPITPAGALLLDHVPGVDSGAGPVPHPISGVPEAADLVALDASDSLQILLCLDVPVALGPPGAISRIGDVLGWDGVNLTRVFDSAAVGVPVEVGCDAVARRGSDILMSFDTAMSLNDWLLPGDVAIWNGVTLLRSFDAVAAGLPTGANVDALTAGPGAALWVSLDTGGGVQGIRYADEDVLAYEPGTGNWSVVRRLGGDSARWGAADLDALSVQFESDQLFANGFE
jgi:hypothetical protein